MDRWIFISLFLLYSKIAFSVEIATESAPLKIEKYQSMIICKLNKGVRTLHVVHKEGQCNMVYSKGIKTEVLGTGQFTASCIKVMNNVRSNLEKSGWSCREVKESRMSQLSTEE